MDINLTLFKFIHDLSGKFWLFDWIGIFLAEYLGYILVLIAAIFLIKEKSWRQRIYFFSLSALSVILARGVITEIIRFFYPQDRPFMALQFQPLISHEVSFSFPSGHATAYFALALAVFYINRKWGWRFLATALIMGLARIYVGIHWPLDILVGALIGLGSAFLVKNVLPNPQFATNEIESSEEIKTPQ
jgi:undecaprenyl-diphosphatase